VGIIAPIVPKGGRKGIGNEESISFIYSEKIPAFIPTIYSKSSEKFFRTQTYWFADGVYTPTFRSRQGEAGASSNGVIKPEVTIVPLIFGLQSRF
jgi:hypothetical protein